jgi:transglutaminase-like putative cysteine protease
MQRYFQISVHALIVSAFIALALTGRLDGPSMVFFTIGLAVSVFRTLRRMPPLLTPRSAFYFSCGYILFFVFDTFLISGSFIPASIHLVLFLEIAKLYQEKKDRDYFYLIVLSFLQVLAASSLTIDMSFVAALFLFLVALVSTLMSFDMYRSERKTQTPVHRVSVPLSGMSLWATVWIIVIGVAIFFTIPRVGTGYFSRADTQSLLMTGFTDMVQLGDIGQVKMSSAVVMHARQISGPPFAVLKWRGISLDNFDGHNWRKTDRKRLPVARTLGGEYLIAPGGFGGEFARYDILLEPLATTTLFGPYRIRSVSGPLPGMEVDGDDSAYLRFQTVRRVEYQVVSEVPNRKRWMTAPQEEVIPPEMSLRYLNLPANTDPRIADLAKQITAKGPSIIDKAALVEGYLKKNYRYTLNLTWPPGPQPVATFLFDAKAGNCEYFASSMAILLRTVGVPTRIVNGFMMGEYNPVGGDYIVRQSDAHSWVEVYVPGHVWLDFDPTPPDPNHRDEDFAMQISHYIDAMQLFWNSYVLIYDSGAQLQLFRSAQDRVQTIQSSIREKSSQWMTRSTRFSDRFASVVRRWVENVWFWVAAAFLALAITTWQHQKQLKTHFDIWRLRRGRGQVNQDVVEQLFYRAARLAEGRAAKRKPAETWREWIFGLPDANRRSILSKALDIFEKSKYGRLPVSAAEFALLEESIKELKL